MEKVVSEKIGPKKILNRTDNCTNKIFAFVGTAELHHTIIYIM